jgi:RimJ/RimL family protein N-acetyltransferase
MKHEKPRELILLTQRLCLQPIRPDDGPRVHEAIVETYETLIPWRVWVWGEKHELTPAHYEEFGRRKFRMLKEGKDITLLIFERSSGTLVGGVSLNKIAPDNSHGYLGFWLRRGYTGRGYANEAARRMIEFAFENLGHDHVNAAHQLGNLRSRATLLRLGFQAVSTSQNPDMKTDWSHYTKPAPARY